MKIEEVVAWCNEYLNKSDKSPLSHVLAQRVLFLATRVMERMSEPELQHSVPTAGALRDALNEKGLDTSGKTINVENFIEKFPWTSGKPGHDFSRANRNLYEFIEKNGPIDPAKMPHIDVYPGFVCLSAKSEKSAIYEATFKNAEKIWEMIGSPPDVKTRAAYYNFIPDEELFLAKFAVDRDPNFVHPAHAADAEKRYADLISKFQVGKRVALNDKEIIANFVGTVKIGYSYGPAAIIQELRHLSKMMQRLGISEETQSQVFSNILVVMIAPTSNVYKNPELGIRRIVVGNPIDEVAMGYTVGPYKPTHFSPQLIGQQLPAGLRDTWHSDKPEARTVIKRNPYRGSIIGEEFWAELTPQKLDAMVNGRWDELKNVKDKVILDANGVLYPALVPGALQFNDESDKFENAKEAMGGHRFRPFRHYIKNIPEVKETILDVARRCGTKKNQGINLPELMNFPVTVSLSGNSSDMEIFAKTLSGKGFKIVKFDKSNSITLDNLAPTIASSSAFAFSDLADPQSMILAISLFTGFQTRDPDLHYDGDPNNNASLKPVILLDNPSARTFLNGLEHLRKVGKTAEDGTGAIKQDPKDLFKLVASLEQMEPIIDHAAKLSATSTLIHTPHKVTPPIQEIFPERERPDFNVCVYGSASMENKQALDDAEKLGAMIANKGWGLVYGGGNKSIMGAAQRGATNAGGYTASATPARFKPFSTEASKARGLDEKWYVHDMYERVRDTVDKSDAFIIDFGGAGAWQELYILLSLKKAGYPSMKDKEISVVNAPDPISKLAYWQPVVDLAIEHGFSPKDDFKIAASREQAIEQIEQFKNIKRDNKKLNASIKAVLFDWDGALVGGFDEAMLGAMKEALQKTGISIADQFILERDDKKRWDSHKNFVKAVGKTVDGLAVNDQLADQFQNHYSALYREKYYKDVYLLPGAKKTIEALHNAGIPMGVISNKREALVQMEAENLGVANMFKMIAGGRLGVAKKPSAQPILNTLKEMGIVSTKGKPDIDGVLFVGDTLNDADGARAFRRIIIGNNDNRIGFAQNYRGITFVKNHTELLDHLNKGSSIKHSFLGV